MITRGTDIMFHGQLDKGVLNGTNIMSFIPLHLNAMVFSNFVEPCYIKFCLACMAEVLALEDWFGRGHNMKVREIGANALW